MSPTVGGLLALREPAIFVEWYPHCELSFCEHHISPEAHICLAFAKEREWKSELFFLGIESYVYAMVAESTYFLTHVVAA